MYSILIYSFGFIQKSGGGHSKKARGFLAADRTIFPLHKDFVEIFGKRILRPSEPDTFGFSGGNPFRLALPYVLSFVLRDKRQNLKNNVTQESPDKILAAARVKQRHVNDTDIYALFFGQISPLFKDLGVVPAKSVDTLDIEKIVLFEFTDKLFIFWPIEIFAALFVDIKVPFGDSILVHCDQLAVLMLVPGTDANVTINASHVC